MLQATIWRKVSVAPLAVRLVRTYDLEHWYKEILSTAACRAGYVMCIVQVESSITFITISFTVVWHASLPSLLET